MTVASEINHNQYVGNGVTTSFDYGFRIFKNSHLLVQVSDLDGVITTLVLGTDYTVTGVGASGGKVVLTVPLASGWGISIDRNLPIVQETDLRNQGTFYAETHEDAFDYLTMLIQRVYSYFTLALRKPSWLAKFYDAQGNRISNLSDPVKDQDAVTKNYSDSQAQANLSKTLRVPDSFIAPLPSIASLEGNVIGIVNGKPVGVPVPSGSAADVLLQLAKATGSNLVGTNHRGTLQLDLDAIDRRPDGYGNSIASVLANGNDVEINTDISISAAIPVNSGKHVRGVGGTITETTGLAAVLRLDGFNVPAKTAVTVSDLDAQGSVSPDDDTNESVESYGVFSYNSLYLTVRGLRASGLTGGAYLGQSQSAIVSDITAHDTVYHPNLQRGGYAVLTDGSKETIINNVSFAVGAGTNGRHLLYMSTGGHGVFDENRNIIANNLIGRYSGKNDRNFPVVVIRKSTRFIINNLIADGANGGVAFNHQNGEITDHILSNLNIDLVKYANGVGVYGVSQGDTPFIGTRWIISNALIRVRPASGLDSKDCVAVALTHSNGLLQGLVCSVPNGSSPILIGDSATNISIDGVLDNTLAYDAIATAPLIAFTGSSASNIKVSGIKTSRPVFNRIAVVTDLTVDYQRKARIAVNGSGASSKIDTHEIIGSITLSATNVTINFPNHVTQNAVENVMAAGTAGAYQALITNIGAKTITVTLYTPSGVLINPQTTSASFNVILSS